MNIHAILKVLFVAGAALCLFACGGGGSSTGGGQETLVSGVAQAGIFSGATVKIYGYDASGNQVQLPTTPVTVTTDSKGRYQANIHAYTGAVVVKVFGTYHDEASGKDITIAEADALQAAMANAAGVITVPVTPLTDLAVRKAQAAGDLRVTIAAANAALSTLFGFDIIATEPVTPTVSALQGATVTDSQKKYTIALAVLSEYMLNDSSTPALPTAADLRNALTQLSGGITVTGGTPRVTSPQVAFKIQQAAKELASGASMPAVVTAGGSAAQTLLAYLATIGNSTGNKILAIRLRTAGSYSGTIIGVQASMALPGGVIVRADAVSGATLQGSVVASGSALGAAVSGKVASGTLTVGVISSGFAIGEFATVYCDVPVTSTLTAADFTNVTNIKTVDTDGAAISGITMAAF